MHPLVIEGQAQHVLVDASVDADLLVIGRTGSRRTASSPARLGEPLLRDPRSRRPSWWSPPTCRSAPSRRSSSDSTAVTTPVRRSGGRSTSPVPPHACGPSLRSRWRRGSTRTSSRDRFGDEIDAEEARIIRALDAVDPDGRAERSIVLTGPRQALADAQPGSELIVVGTRGHGLIAAGLLGSVSAWLLHDSAVPVVVVPNR